MKREIGMNRQAFWMGFFDSFGNIGRVYEPIVNGVEVEKEILRPATASLLCIKPKKSASYRQLMRTGFRASQIAKVKSGSRKAA